MEHVWTVFAFLHHLPLVAILAIVVVLTSGGLGRPLGVHLLVWHERSWPRFAAGMALTLLVAEVALVGLLLDRDALARLEAGLVPGSHFLTIWATAAIATLVAMMAASRNPFAGRSLRHRAAFPAGVAVGVVAFMTVLEARGTAPFTWLAGHSAPVVARLSAALGMKDLPTSPELHGLAAVLTVLLALGFVVGCLDRHARIVTPVVSVCTLLGLLASCFGAVAFWLDSRLPVAVISIIALAGVLKLAGARPYKVRYPGLPEARLEEYGTTVPEPELLALERPITARPDDGRPLVVVCVSGGASRAAAWTAAVLARLEAEVPDFSARTALVTGASGGMVGAAYHVAGLQPGGGEVRGRPWTLTSREAVQRLGADNLSHVVHRLVHADLPSLLSPWALADRGQALEEAWSETLDGRLNKPLADLREGENAGWRPSLVFSPMLVEDGRRLLVSNLNLAEIATNEGGALGAPGGVFRSRSEIELRKLFPEDGGKLTLATAARMSASFPFVSPAATLPTVPRRRVVDAGYYDNYGVNLATIWLDAVRGSLGDRRVVIVQIRDGPSEATLATIERPKDESTCLSRGLEWLTSPIQAVLAARNAVMAYRNDEAVEILQRSLPNVTTVIFEAPEGVSMTWYLAEEEQKRLLAGLASEEFDRRVEALKRWWSVPKQTLPVP